MIGALPEFETDPPSGPFLRHNAKIDLHKAPIIIECVGTMRRESMEETAELFSRFFLAFLSLLSFLFYCLLFALALSPYVYLYVSFSFFFVIIYLFFTKVYVVYFIFHLFFVSFDFVFLCLTFLSFSVSRHIRSWRMYVGSVIAQHNGIALLYCCCLPGTM